MRNPLRHVGAVVTHSTLAVLLVEIAEAQQVQIQHRPLQCWASDQFTTVSFEVEPTAEVRSVKVYYRAVQHTMFYFVEPPVPGDASVEVPMPKPSEETLEVVYFIEAVSLVYDTTRTPPRRVPVLPAKECRRRDPDAAWFDGDDPKIAIRAISPDAPAVTPGFQSAGLAGGRDTPVAIFAALGAGAAAGAVVLIGTDDSAPGSGSPGASNGGGTGSGGNPGSGTGATPPAGSPPPATTTVPGSSPTTTAPPATTTTAPPTTTTTMERLADLGVSISDSIDPVPVGTAVTFTIVVTNNGPDTANGTTLAVTFPTSVALAGSSGASCSGLIGTQVTCNLSSMASGSSRTVEMIVVPATPGQFGVTAQASANERDPVASNNSASESTTVTLTLKAVQESMIELETQIIARSAHGEIRTEGGSFRVVNGAPLYVRFDTRSETTLIEASFSSAHREDGAWRFDFANSETFVPGSIIVEAGEPLVHGPKVIVFKIFEDGVIRFRYRVAR